MTMVRAFWASARAGDEHELLLAARNLRGGAICQVCDSDALERLPGALGVLFRRA